MAVITTIGTLVRGFRLGYQTINTLMSNDSALQDLVAVEHDEDDGSHTTRRVPSLEATYKWTGTEYTIQASVGAGYLNSTVTPSGVGDYIIDLAFSPALPTANYGVILTPGIDDDGRPGQIGCYFDTSGAYKTATALRLLTYKCGSTTAGKLDGFTLALFFGQ